MKYQDIKVGLSIRVTETNGDVWNGILLHKMPNSYTKVLIMDNDRGPGWDEFTQSYKGFYTDGTGPANGKWSRGQNNDYGKDFERHIKQLEIN